MIWIQSLCHRPNDYLCINCLIILLSTSSSRICQLHMEMKGRSWCTLCRAKTTLIHCFNGVSKHLSKHLPLNIILNSWLIISRYFHLTLYHLSISTRLPNPNFRNLPGHVGHVGPVGPERAAHSTPMKPAPTTRTVDCFLFRSWSFWYSWDPANAANSFWENMGKYRINRYKMRQAGTSIPLKPNVDDGRFRWTCWTFEIDRSWKMGNPGGWTCHTFFSDSYVMVIFGDLNDRAKNPPLWSGRIESKSGMQHHATVRKCKKHILRSPPSGSIWILMASIQYTWVRFLTRK